MNTELYRESNPVMPTMFSLLMAISLIALVFVLLYFTMSETIELNSAAGWTFISVILVVLFLAAFLFVFRIKTIVTYESLTVGLFRGRVVPIRDIDSVKTEEFSAMKDYLGWGIKIGRKGLGYITAGTNKGLRINLKTGKSFFISSKRTFEFESAVRMAIKSVRDH